MTEGHHSGSDAQAAQGPGHSLWQACLDQLAQELPEQQFNTWIKPLTAQVADDFSRATVYVANRFKLDWVRAQYAGRISALLEKIYGQPVAMELALTPRESVARPYVSSAIAAFDAAPDPGLAAEEAAANGLRNRLNTALTFDTLVEGTANRMARAAAMHVVRDPPRTRGRVARMREAACTSTVIGGAPVIAEAVFAEADRRGLTSLPLRCIALGGAMIPPTVVESANRFGVRVVRVYGSSEVPFSTSTALDAYSSDDGVALPGVDVAIGDSGELLISGPHQFHGYLDPVHNDESFDGDQVRTGDLAELLTDHRIRITGRLKEIVIRKGKKISLPEIDLAATGLGECAAFAVPDEQTGERLALAIRGTTTAVTYQAVRDELTAVGLAVWKLPEQIVVWSGEFPRTPSGKVIRRALADESRWIRVLYAPRLAGVSGQRI